MLIIIIIQKEKTLPCGECVPEHEMAHMIFMVYIQCIANEARKLKTNIKHMTIERAY